MRGFHSNEEYIHTMLAMSEFKATVALILSDTVEEYDAAFEAMPGPDGIITQEYDPIKTRAELKAYMEVLLQHWLNALTVTTHSNIDSTDKINKIRDGLVNVFRDKDVHVVICSWTYTDSDGDINSHAATLIPCEARDHEEELMRNMAAEKAGKLVTELTTNVYMGREPE